MVNQPFSAQKGWRDKYPYRLLPSAKENLWGPERIEVCSLHFHARLHAAVWAIHWLAVNIAHSWRPLCVLAVFEFSVSRLPPNARRPQRLNTRPRAAGLRPSRRAKARIRKLPPGAARLPPPPPLPPPPLLRTVEVVAAQAAMVGPVWWSPSLREAVGVPIVAARLPQGEWPKSTTARMPPTPPPLHAPPPALALAPPPTLAPARRLAQADLQTVKHRRGVVWTRMIPIRRIRC